MTFEITQQDLDICKMNGINENDLNGFIADRQGWGLSDEEINARLRMLINDCKQTTPQSENDLQNISKWKQQPPISPFEYGKMNSYAIINDAKNSLSFTPEINPQSPSERQRNGFTPDDISLNEYESLKKGVKYLGKKINEQGEKLGKWVVYRNLNKEFYEPTGRTDKIGFWEATKDIVKQGTALPFVGGYVSGAQKQIILDIDEKIKNGEKISADEAYAYECLLNKVKEERTRGYSNWGLIGSSVLPSMVRFGGEIALTGGTMNALGVTTKLPKAASISQKFAHGVKDSLKLGTAATALNPSEIYDRYQNRTFENQMKLTPEGETYFVDSLEKPATTFLKSMGDVFLSFACEGSGSALGATGEFIGNGLSKGVAKVTDPVLQHIVKNKNMRKLVEEVCPKILDSAQKKFSQFDKFFDKTRFLADKVKFDGFLEEIGEEKLEDYLSLTFGLQDEKPSLENYVKAFGDLDDWAVLSGSILLQGSVLSATSRILEKSLKKSSAMSDEEIQEVVNSLPITEQREVVKNMIDNGLIQPEIVQKVQSEEFWKDLQNQRYQQHIEKGLSEQNAKVAASLDSLFGAMFSNLFNVSDEEAADLLPTFKSEEFRNKEQFKQKIERSRFIRKIQDDFKDSDTLSDYLSEINSTEYENLSPEEKYNYAVSREIEKYDNEHISNKPLDNKTEYVVDDEYSPKNLNILQGRVEYNDNVNENNSDEISESSQDAEMPIKLSQDEIYDIMGEIGDINDGELIDPFLRALQGQADTNDVEQLKNAVSGLQHGGSLEYILNNQNGNTFYQSAVTAGAETSAEISDAQKEWREKGTDSKYFKKWFGDSKVVDENGQPLVVYHGSPSHDITTFDSDKTLYGEISKGFNFFTNKKSAYQNSADDYANFAGTNGYRRNGKVYETYLKIQKPLHIKYTSNAMSLYKGDKQYSTPVEYYDTNYKEIKEKYNNGDYDGIIIENTDKNNDDSIIYLVPNSEQIKSVDNQGTFDESNPNIYFQTGINQGEITNIDGSIVNDVSNPLDYDYLNNQVTGEKVAIEINQDIKVEEIKPQNISSDLPFNVSKKTSENKKAIKQILNIDKGKILNLTNNATNESVEFKGTTIDESISKISINDGRYNDCCLILCNSKKLFETSQKILSHNDVKKVSDLKYSRYANIAQINDKQYLLEFVIKGKNKLTLYSITPIKNDIAKRVDKSSQHDIAINSIAHIQDVFKTKLVQQYNNDYKNAYKNNNLEQSQKRTGYVLEQQSSSQPNLFAESASERLGDNSENLYVQPKNSYRGRAVLDKQLILVTATGDVSTVVHEYAHWYLGILQDAEGYSDKVDDQLYAIRKYLNNDGSPFTRQQHEKFAKSFENYIYRGTAKNSKLREIYEDIKNVLYNIYEIIQKGEYFIGGENPLSDEDMANSNAVFEEIFRLENNNLQERVFKKIDDCNNMIADVKNKEKEEIARIYQIRDNIKQNIKEQGEIEKSVREIKEFAEKYAEKKENAKWKLYNEDRQNTAYNILSNALGLPVADIKRKLHSRFAKTREDIELKLREVGDKLSAGDYFYDEKVIEYFGSIDMTDTDSSQQLVNMALDAIDTKVNLDSPLNRDINEFLNKFDYLKKQFAKYKGKQRSLIIDVIGDLFNELTSSSLPSVFISDFSTEMQKLTENYEEALDNRAAKTTNSEFYGLVLAKLKNVKLYSAADKHAVKINHLHNFYSKLPLAKTANGTEKLIREINNALIRDIEMRKKSIIAKEIAKQLRVNSRTQKVGSRVKKGLYDWKTNSVWLDMVKFNNMNMAELSSELEKVLTPEIKAICNVDDGLKEMTTAKENSSTVDFSFESKMKKKFIEYKLSGKLENANSALMLDLLSDILEFKNKARKAKSEKELHDRLQKYAFRNNLAERILNNPNKIKKVIKYLFKNNSLLNWNTILRVCFGNDVAEKYSIDNEENEKVIYENKILTNFYNKALKCYKLNKTKGLRKFFFDPHGIHEFQKLFRDYEKETFSTNETIYDFKTKEEKTSPILLNRAQLITMFTWYQNELLKKRLINQFGGEYYGEKELERLFNHLSDEDKQFAFLLMQTCDDMYDDVNEVMIRSQGLSMEKNENYFPSVVRRRGDSIDNVSLVNCRIGQPSATKKRVKSQFVAMKPLNPLSILSRHIDTMSSYVCVSEKASFVSEIFGSPDLQRAFENAFDEQYTEFINNIGIDKSSLSKSVTPIALDNNSIPDFKTVSELKNWICENVDLLGNVKIESNGRNVLFSKSNIGRSLKGVQRSDVKQKSYSVLKQLVEKSVYGYDKKVDQKHSKRNNGQEIYYNAFTYKGKTFGVEISIDKPFSKKSPNTYAGHKIKIIETVPATSRNGSMPSYGSDTATPEINGTKLPDLTSATISISNIVKAFNPIKDIKVHKNKTTDGKEFWDLLSGQLAASTFFKYSQSVRTMTENVRKWINNWIVSLIALSPKIAFGQLLSCVNYADGNDISVMDWAKGFIYCMAHPKETIEYMKQDEYLQARFKGNLQNETMQSLLSQYDKWNEVRTFFTANIRIGDMLAIMFGGKPYIDHLMKQGISKEEAFARFRRKTNEAQQSTLPSTISNFQRTSQSNAVSALFLAFTNTPHQYERKVIESIAELCRGQDKKTANKNLILYRIVSPLLFEFVLQDLGIWLVMGAVGGDDDKGKIALIAAINSLLLGNYGAYGAMGIFGAFLVNVVCNCMSDKNMPFSTSSIPMLSSAERNVYSILNDIKKGDLKTEHLISAAALAGDLSTGMPLTKMSNMANGIGNMMIDGDFMVGLHKALGWGDSASRQAFE